MIGVDTLNIAEKKSSLNANTIDQISGLEAMQIIHSKWDLV